MRPLLAMLAALAPLPAFAHSGNPAEARVTAPDDVGVEADESFRITWLDTDTPIPTGTAAVNLFYTERMPPTFFPGEIPDQLEGTPIVSGIPEPDTENAYVWDTRAVPSGTYWIWSRIDEPPEPMPSPVYLSFSKGPLHVRHPGDPIGPAVRITRPNTEIAYSDQEYEIRYRAFDPNGTATVRLEAGTSLDGTGFTLIADDLPATSTGAFVWDTSELEEADWTIRAVISDEVATSTAYSPYFLLVTHFIPGRDAGPRPDAGVRRDASVMDASTTSPEDPEDGEEGCRCAAAPANLGSLWLLPFLLLFSRRVTKSCGDGGAPSTRAGRA